jgi:hypothetical protein
MTREMPGVLSKERARELDQRLRVLQEARSRAAFESRSYAIYPEGTPMTTPEPYGDETVEAKFDPAAEASWARALKPHDDPWLRWSDADRDAARHKALVDAINEHGCADIEYRQQAAAIAALRLSGTDRNQTVVELARQIEAYLRGEDR